MKSIFSSTETLFSKLGIYFNICLLGNGHLLHRHRVSDIWSLSSRRLWGQSHISWPHTMWVNFFFFSVYHILTLFSDSVPRLACLLRNTRLQIKANQNQIAGFSLSFELLTQTMWLIWFELCEAHCLFFGLNNADKHTLYSFSIFFAGSYMYLTGVQQ